MKNIRDVVVLGVGMCKFDFIPERGQMEMGEESIWNALQDAGVKPKDIQIAYCGTIGWDGRLGPFIVGHQIMQQLGITGIPIIRVENVCAGGAFAVREAWLALQSGLYDIALAVGIEKSTSPVTGKAWDWRERLHVSEEEESSRGLFPTIFGSMLAKGLIENYGTTREQLSMVAVKNRYHASMNPNACFQNPISLEEVLSARLIATHLTLYDCCPSCDGCAAVVLASADVARKFTTKPVYVAASAAVSGTYPTHILPFLGDTQKRAAELAYEMAGIGPKDLDLAGVHEPFTSSELSAYADIGLCKLEEVGRLVESGITKLGGRTPINVDGGSLSRGHPFAATGPAQIAEVVWQLRGQAGKRQVKGAKVGLTLIQGGIHEGDQGNAIVHIFKK